MNGFCLEKGKNLLRPIRLLEVMRTTKAGDAANIIGFIFYGLCLVGHRMKN